MIPLPTTFEEHPCPQLSWSYRKKLTCQPGLMKDLFGRVFSDSWKKCFPLVHWQCLKHGEDEPSYRTFDGNLFCRDIPDKSKRQLQGGGFLTNVVGTSPQWERRELGDIRLSNKTCLSRRKTLGGFNIHR